MGTLTGKIALVTGASRGIGKAIALHLAEEGANIIVHYAHDQLAAQQTATEIQRKNQKAYLVKADLLHMTEVKSLCQQVDGILDNQKLDILVNNAGILIRAGMGRLTEEQFDHLFAINVKAPFFITEHALQRLKDGGRIINLSSQVSLRPRFEVGAYAMTKAAIDNFTMSLASVLGERGITVNAVSPGLVDTEMNKDKLKDEKVRMQVAEKIALKRIGVPDDIARVVAFLASDAAGWISGQCIEASGGAGLIHG